MAKSKPDRKNRKRKKTQPGKSMELSPAMAQPLLEQAAALLHTGQPEDALPVAKKALRCLAAPLVSPEAQLPVLELLGEIEVELGNPDEARKAFVRAAELDPEGLITRDGGAGAEKFLWLAQLSEVGGAESLAWFEKGIAVLRREIAVNSNASEILEEKKSKLANALCGVAELYMTDLSWEADAEQQCESFVTEACLVAPDSPEPLQTLASVRMSQFKLVDARSALQRSLDLWFDLPPNHEDIPDFPTRISLVRLLMEAEMEDKALDVLERLIADDDTSVEAWYLGGWCLHLMSDKKQLQKEATTQSGTDEGEERLVALKNSRRWLQQSLKLYAMLDYEDERLHDHAEDLVKQLNGILGPMVDGDEEEDDDWEELDDQDEDDDEDEAMTET